MCFTTPFKVLAISPLYYTVNWTQALLQVKMAKEILLPSTKHISPASYGHATLQALVLATEKWPIPWDQAVHTTNKPPPSNNNLVWSKAQFLRVIPLRPAPTTVLPKRSVYLLFYSCNFCMHHGNPLVLLWGFKCWKMSCPQTQLLPKVKQPPHAPPGTTSGTNKELKENLGICKFFFLEILCSFKSCYYFSRIIPGTHVIKNI